MKKIEELKKMISGGEFDEKLAQIYLDKDMIPYNRERYVKALDKFVELFGDQEVAIYSAPGRSEVCGNHTDHQNGHVLATSINLDAIAIVAPREDGVIELVSDDMPKEVINVNDIEQDPALEGTTTALIKGVVAGIRDYGFKVGGFTAFVTSDVLMGAGMSSSAAFESLIGTILSGLYNDMKVSSVDVAKIGQYAENVYFGKPCGLMDQMACAVGGLIYIDFFDKANPVIKQVPVDFEAHQYSLCIVDTKGSHADLTDDYAAIPAEMKQVAEYFGEELLSRVSEEDFISKVGEMRASGKVNDRAVLRTLHFYTEQDRVAEGVAALENQEFDHFLDVIKRSGDSSFKLLQNIYSAKDPLTQNVSIALGFSEKFIGENGVCRVHGGGFAGTIQAFVKNAAVAEYKKNIESIFGEGACHVLKVRPYGGIKVVE